MRTSYGRHFYMRKREIIQMHMGRMRHLTRLNLNQFAKTGRNREYLAKKMKIASKTQKTPGYFLTRGS